MAINPAYTFVRNMAQRFDNAHFQASVTTIEGRHSFKPELLKIAMLQSEVSDLTMEKVSRCYIQNTQHWMYTTGLLGRQKKTLNIYCMNGTATHLLVKLNAKINGRVSTTVQLWDRIFQEVYANADASNKQAILTLANQVSRDDMQTTVWEVRLYRISKLISAFFSHPVVKFAVGVCVWWGARRVVKVAIDRFKFSYIPQLVNHVINKAPLPIIRKFNQVRAFGEAIYVHRLDIWLSALTLRWTIGLRIQLVNQITTWISDLIYLPYTLQRELAWLPFNIAVKLGNLSYQTQGRISASVSHITDNALQEKLDLGGKKAYKVWMRILEQAKKEGICQLLSSQQA